MSSLVVIGTQWGDEGKGKITDYLTDKSDVVVRYQGGNNAGHTVIANGMTYKLHTIPSGTIQNKLSVIGSGVVIDPVSMLEEMDTLEKQGISFENLLVDKRAHIIMPYHKLFDALNEERLAENKIGTTKRGIGPAYTDKVKRIGIRMCDFIDKDLFPKKLKANLDLVNEELKEIYDHEPLNYDDIFKQYTSCADRLRKYVKDGSVIVYDYIKEGKKVLFEGAQGTLLDLDFGTYPFVTSSHPTSAGVCAGSGIGPCFIDNVVGIAKAYTTRVGEGPFPTELFDKEGEFLREKGHEYGVTTGRARRCGWLDVVILKYAARVNSLTSIALTKLDTLTGLDKIKICVGYELDGKVITDFPAELSLLERCKPVYEVMDGWKEDITGAKSFDDLCENAKKYVKRAEELCGVKFGIISVGPDREQTIIIGKYFE